MVGKLKIVVIFEKSVGELKSVWAVGSGNDRDCILNDEL